MCSVSARTGNATVWCPGSRCERRWYEPTTEQAILDHAVGPAQAYLRLLARDAPLEELERIVVSLRKRATRGRVTAAEPLGQLCVLAWDGFMGRLQRGAQWCTSSHTALSAAAAAAMAGRVPPPSATPGEQGLQLSDVAAATAVRRAVGLMAPAAAQVGAEGAEAEGAGAAVAARILGSGLKRCAVTRVVETAAHLQQQAAEVVRRCVKAAKLAKDVAWREMVDPQQTSTATLAHALARALALLAWCGLLPFQSLDSGWVKRLPCCFETGMTSRVMLAALPGSTVIASQHSAALTCRLHGVHGTVGGRDAVPTDVFMDLNPRTLLSCGSDIETQLRAGQMHDRKRLTFPKALTVRLQQPEAPPPAPAPAPAAPALPSVVPLTTGSLLDIHGAAQALLTGSAAPPLPSVAGIAPGLLLQQVVSAAAAASTGAAALTSGPAPAAAAVGEEPQPGMRRKRAVTGPAPADPPAKAFRSAQLGVAGMDGSITGWAMQQQGQTSWERDQQGPNDG